MKRRAFLIVTGTLGSLAAVLSITPPKFSADSALAKQDAASTNTDQTNQNQNQTNPNPSPSQSQNQSSGAAAKSAKQSNSYEQESEDDGEEGKSQPAKSKPKAPTTSTTPTPTPTPSQSQTQTPNSQSATSVSGTFTGNAFEASERGRSWGTVVVKVTFKDGVISSVKGNQSPASRGPFAIDQLDPYVAAQKISIDSIKAKSAEALPYVSGVSYTSIAYWNSLKSAIKKAGL
jgi:uncharacterized protein with FMN-binding domain